MFQININLLPNELITKIALILKPLNTLKFLVSSKAFERVLKDPRIIEYIDQIPDIYHYIKLEEKSTLIRLTLRNCTWSSYKPRSDLRSIHRNVDNKKKCSGWRHFRPLNKKLICLEIQKTSIYESRTWHQVGNKLQLILRDERNNYFIIKIPYNSHTKDIYFDSECLYEWNNRNTCDYSGED